MDATKNLVVNEIDFRCNSACPNGMLAVSWSSDAGFGHWEAISDGNGKFITYTECMDSNDDKSFSKAILTKVMEKIYNNLSIVE